MKTFSITEMELLTGIKMGTIRIWEKRYQLLLPVRNNGGNRLYSIDDLKKMLAISLLIKSKRRISYLAGLSTAELIRDSQSLDKDEQRFQKPLSDLIVAMYELDYEALSFILDSCLLTIESCEVMNKIVFPFLMKTGLIWNGSRLTEEHFAVTIMRNKLIRCIEEIGINQHPGKKILLFLPDTKQLDLLLLFTQFQLKKSGFAVIYMGYDVTMPNLETIIRLKKPHYIFTYLPQKTKFKIQTLSAIIESLAPATRCIIVRNIDEPIEPLGNQNIHIMNYDRALTFLSGRSA